MTSVFPTRIGMRAAAMAGLLAGGVYLLMQMSFSAWLRDSSYLAPLQRIAAIVLGQDAAPPSDGLTAGATVIALLVHFGLAIAYAACAGAIFRQMEKWEAISVGPILGYALYIVNFLLIAPRLFPWFEPVDGPLTALAHVMFGLVCGLVYVEIDGRERQQDEVQPIR